MTTNFKEFKKGQLFRIDIVHNYGNGNFIETIFSEFVSVNTSEQRDDYVESITINQIIGIEKYIKKIEGWTLTPRIIDRYILRNSHPYYNTINNTK